MNALESRLKKEKNQNDVSVVFLGDNIYPKGMPDTSDEEYAAAKHSIDRQLTALRSFKGNTYFIPGNHDWERGRTNGLQHVKNQMTYVNQVLNDSVFLPANGCSGPVEIMLGNDLGSSAHRHTVVASSK